jgi:hypothetical protein
MQSKAIKRTAILSPKYLLLDKTKLSKFIKRVNVTSLSTIRVASLFEGKVAMKQFFIYFSGNILHL